MNTGKYVFAQITSFLPQRQFDRIVSKHRGNYKTRQFTCWNQMLCMMFGQLSSRESYPEKIRSIKFYDKEQKRSFVFLTNNMQLKATEIAALYKHRWKIELFFKWIKQHLKIKAFWGRSVNAVKTQVYIAIITYTLVAIIKQKLNTSYSTYEILQILGASLLDKTS